MCSELFRIPYSWGGVPIFGVGVLLAIWAIAGLGSLAVSIRRHGWNGETMSLVPLLAMTGAAILWLPKLFPDGLPIRGYGLMVLLGVVSGVAMATYRARQVGLNHELDLVAGVLAVHRRDSRSAIVLCDRVLGPALSQR